MTIQQLQAFHQARPFHPFRIHLADGRSIDVEHPEFLAAFPSGRTVMVTEPDDTWEVVDLLLVTSLETLNGASRPSRRKRGT